LRRELIWKIFGLAAAVALAIEGALVLAYASPVKITGLGTVGETFVLLAGVQLFAIGLVTIIGWLLKDSSLRLARFAKGRLLSGAILIASLIVMIEGVITVLYAAPTEIGSIGGILQRTVAVFGAQLFVLGAVSAVTWMERAAPFKVRNALAYIAGIVVTGEGLVIVGVAAPTMIEGIGGILERTVALAGAQLLILGLAIVVATLLAGKLKRGSKVLLSVVLVAAAVVTIEGIVLIAATTNVQISGFALITKSNWILAGLQLALLGVVSLYSLNRRTVITSRRLNKASFLAAVFLLLLVPAGLVMP
jgi:hypothetical protein